MIQELMAQSQPTSAVTLSWAAISAITGTTVAVWTAGFKYLQLSTMHSVDDSIKDLTARFMTREVLDLKFDTLSRRLESLTIAVERQSSPEAFERLQTLVIELGALKIDLEHKIKDMP